MKAYIDIIQKSYSDYWNYLKTELLVPSWHNYLYWLIGISLIVWILEVTLPWRTNQKIFRKDFWLDGFYMFFNYFLFSLIAYNAISNVAVDAFNRLLGLLGIHNLIAIEISSWPFWIQFLTMFIIADFIQWNTHRLLHAVPALWEFHKVHHSVEEMGFAAHLRYHWMETIIYKSIQYIPLAMIGFGLKDFFILHIITVIIGHLNHSNLNITYGPFKYIFNNPAMHIWHHAKNIPNKVGVNFGISLSLWDYLFKTNYIPNDGRDIVLGFEEIDRFPKTFVKQIFYPFVKPNDQISS
jgi:sterol desaturase/sphingolipid hydroxylase (fatty acid hydroxylase superfamily)